MFGTCRSMQMMTVAVRICGEVDSMSTSGLSICSALSVEREPSFAPPHGRGCHTDRALPVLCELVYRHGHAASDYSHHDRASCYLWCSGDRIAKRCGAVRAPNVRIMGTFSSGPFTVPPRDTRFKAGHATLRVPLQARWPPDTMGQVCVALTTLWRVPHTVWLAQCLRNSREKVPARLNMSTPDPTVHAW